MKKKIFLIIIIGFSLLVSCQGTGAPNFTQEKSTLDKTITTSLMSSPTQLITTTLINPLPSASETLAATITPIVKETSIPNSTQTAQSDGSLHTQCLQISPTFSGDIGSSGIIVLGTRAGGEQRRYDTLLLNVDSGEKSLFTTQEKYQVENVVSPDNKLMAYQSVVFDANGTFIKYELVIADANGTTLKTIPWEDKWLTLLEWTADQRLLLSYDEPYSARSDGHEFIASYLALDPFSGEQELLQPDVPGFLDIYPSYGWMFWRTVIYDPTLTRVIYPRLMPDNKEEYTLILWDETTKKLVTGLENIYKYFVVFSNTTPMPHWSLDGSQFAFRGEIYVSDELVEFELYRVSRDGEIEQLTSLTSIALIDPYRFSWSPDGKHIAMLIDAWYTHGNTHLAVIDVNTHVVTDYCIPVRGIQYGAPIWSPDGSQLLVMDETDEYRHVILVDIVKNYAAQIAENYDPLGWMVAP
jgi:hypothetical protein